MKKERCQSTISSPGKNHSGSKAIKLIHNMPGSFILSMIVFQGTTLQCYDECLNKSVTYPLIVVFTIDWKVVKLLYFRAQSATGSQMLRTDEYLFNNLRPNSVSSYTYGQKRAYSPIHLDHQGSRLGSALAGGPTRKSASASYHQRPYLTVESSKLPPVPRQVFLQIPYYEDQTDS